MREFGGPSSKTHSGQLGRFWKLPTTPAPSLPEKQGPFSLNPDRGCSLSHVLGCLGIPHTWGERWVTHTVSGCCQYKPLVTTLPTVWGDLRYFRILFLPLNSPFHPYTGPAGGRHFHDEIQGLGFRDKVSRDPYFKWKGMDKFKAGLREETGSGGCGQLRKEQRVGEKFGKIWLHEEEAGREAE